MASEAECRDIIVGVSDAEAVERVKCEYDAAVVSGPCTVGHGGCALAKQTWSICIRKDARYGDATHFDENTLRDIALLVCGGLVIEKGLLCTCEIR